MLTVHQRLLLYKRTLDVLQYLNSLVLYLDTQAWMVAVDKVCTFLDKLGHLHENATWQELDEELKRLETYGRNLS